MNFISRPELVVKTLSAIIMTPICFLFTLNINTSSYLGKVNLAQRPTVL